MIWEIVKEERKAIRTSIGLFNKSDLPYSSINYMFTAKAEGSETRQRIDRDKAEQSTPEVSNAKLTKTKLTLHKKILFKYAVVLPPHSSFRILSQKILPYSTSNGSYSTVWKGTSNSTLKRCLATLSMAKNYNNLFPVGKVFNAPMKVILGIGGYAIKFKISPCKSKQPKLEVMKYIKGGKYPKAEFGKYVYAIIEGQYK